MYIVFLYVLLMYCVNMFYKLCRPVTSSACAFSLYTCYLLAVASCHQTFDDGFTVKLWSKNTVSLQNMLFLRIRSLYLYCASFKKDIFCSVILYWPVLTLWNKPLPNITQYNMYALTMNYAPSLPCIYIFILA